MSSTNRGAKRAPLDAYYTQADVARACLWTLAADLAGSTAWEPHAGGGAFVDELIAARARVSYSDADPEAPIYHRLVAPAASGHVACDALAGWPWTMRERPDWVIGNPPFGQAQEHVTAALGAAKVGVGFLLRLAFLEGQKRAAWWRTTPLAEVYVLSRRPSFTGGGTDSAAYAWFVWRHGCSDPARLGWLEVPRG